MTISRLHIFQALEVLTAANVNGEFNNILTNLTAEIQSVAAAYFAASGLDLNGLALTFDADGDLTAIASTDDVLEIKIGSTVLVKLDLSTASAVNGLTVTPSAAGSPVGLSTFGTDTDVSVLLTPKGAGTLRLANLTAARVLVSDANKGVTASSTTTTNLASLDTTTSLTTQLAGKAATSHSHATSDITSGTFADARIAESNVTQHEAAIDHDALTNFVAAEHIDWSATGAETIHEDRLPASGGLVPLGTVTVSDAATLDIEGFIDSTYEKYEIDIVYLEPETDGVDLYTRYSTDNGSSYISGSNTYRYTGMSWSTNAAVVNWGAALSTLGLMNLSGASTRFGTSGSEYASGKVIIENTGGTASRTALWRASFAYNSETSLFIESSVSVRAVGPTSTLNALRFVFSSGNITAKANVYGRVIPT